MAAAATITHAAREEPVSVMTEHITSNNNSNVTESWDIARKIRADICANAENQQATSFSTYILSVFAGNEITYITSYCRRREDLFNELIASLKVHHYSDLLRVQL